MSPFSDMPSDTACRLGCRLRATCQATLHVASDVASERHAKRHHMSLPSSGWFRLLRLVPTEVSTGIYGYNRNTVGQSVWRTGTGACQEGNSWAKCLKDNCQRHLLVKIRAEFVPAH